MDKSNEENPTHIFKSDFPVTMTLNVRLTATANWGNFDVLTKEIIVHPTNQRFVGTYRGEKTVDGVVEENATINIIYSEFDDRLTITNFAQEEVVAEILNSTKFTVESNDPFNPQFYSGSGTMSGETLTLIVFDTDYSVTYEFVGDRL